VQQSGEVEAGRALFGSSNPSKEQAMAVISEPKAADVKKLVSEATAAGTAKTSKIANEGAAQAQMTVEKNMEQATKATEGVMKAAEQAAEFSRGNAEAMAKATQVYFAGVQDLSKQTMALFQGLSEQAVESAKALATVKSLKEAAEIQTTYTRTAMERTMSETAKLQEASLKLVEASLAPLSARMSLAVETMSKPITA
jgi:phasin family protein